VAAGSHAALVLDGAGYHIALCRRHLCCGAAVPTPGGPTKTARCLPSRK
jgi:hypothetical protein